MADLHQDVPTRNQIQLRAYELYLKRGGQDGRDVDDWLAAETELRNQHSSTGRFDKRDDSQQKSRTFAASSGSKSL
ncbi:MAG TPA: DUF2934 domain-containing protein [Candidatus Angelobacter sp.]|nr:DUF2934 domain-containing protein [Candidatus Angelobacter sp.]